MIDILLVSATVLVFGVLLYIGAPHTAKSII